MQENNNLMQHQTEETQIIISNMELNLDGIISDKITIYI